MVLPHTLPRSQARRLVRFRTTELRQPSPARAHCHPHIIPLRRVYALACVPVLYISSVVQDPPPVLVASDHGLLQLSAEATGGAAGVMRISYS